MSLYPNAIIFAGGKSSRMGTNKALLPFGKEETLIAYQCTKLQNIFQQISISAKEDIFSLPCSVITDIYRDSSPLVGIISIFETMPELEEVFILSVDAPFVDEHIITPIMEANENAVDVIVAKSPNGIQPLCGLYKRSILPFAKAQYKKGNHKLQDLLALVNTKNIVFENNLPFSNLNHPKEYEEALKLSLS